MFELAFGNELGTIRVCNGTELELEDVANTVMLSPGVQQVERPVVGPYPRPQLLAAEVSNRVIGQELGRSQDAVRSRALYEKILRRPSRRR